MSSRRNRRKVVIDETSEEDVVNVEIEEEESGSQPKEPHYPSRDIITFPLEKQKEAFLAKFSGTYLTEKVVHPTLLSYAFRPLFRRLGWESILELGYVEDNTVFYFPDLCVQFMSTLKKEGDWSLTGTVNGVEITLTKEFLRENQKVDVLKKPYIEAYSNLKKADYLDDDRYYQMVANICSKTTIEDARKKKKIRKMELTPLGRVLWKIITVNVNPRQSDMAYLREIEVIIIHALLHGTPQLSWACLCLGNIWEAYNSWRRQYIPFCGVLSSFFLKKGVVGEQGVDQKVIVPSNSWTIDEKMFKGEVLFRTQKGIRELVDPFNNRITRICPVGEENLSFRVDPSKLMGPPREAPPPRAGRRRARPASPEDTHEETLRMILEQNKRLEQKFDILARRQEELAFINEQQWRQLATYQDAVTRAFQFDRDNVLGHRDNAPPYPHFPRVPHLAFFPEFACPQPDQPATTAPRPMPRYDTDSWSQYFGQPRR